MTNLEAYHDFVERGYNRQDLSVVEEICSPEFISHQYLAPAGKGVEALKQDIREVIAAFSDVKLTVRDSAQVGDKVWSRIEADVVDRASGKALNFMVMDVIRFEDGKLVEHWGVPDRFAVLHQTGQLQA